MLKFQVLTSRTRIEDVSQLRFCKPQPPLRRTQIEGSVSEPKPLHDELLVKIELHDALVTIMETLPRGKTIVMKRFFPSLI